MIISIIGTNGMLSNTLTNLFSPITNTINVFGIEEPKSYSYTNYYEVDLLNGEIDYNILLLSDLIIYAAGAGVQAAINTDSSLMYLLNANIPIEITIQLRKRMYNGIFISFGSYMEIGLNMKKNKSFSEKEVICSTFPVTNDYALSKRLYSRYMGDLKTNYRFWHFILPNLFSYNDKQPDSRLIPYVINYLEKIKAGFYQETPKFSSGEQERQFVMLEEIYEVINRAIINKLPSGVYNIGGGEFLKVRDLIERIFNIYNVACPDYLFGKETRRDNDIKSLQLNGEKLNKLIHYLPKNKIEEIFLR